MYLTQLYPTPKTLEAKPGEPFHFGASVRVVLPKNTSLAVIENVKKLWHRFTFTASKLEVITTGQGHFAMFYLPEKTAGIPNSIQPGNYYRIKVDSRAAIVGAVSEKALVDGISMLAQLIIPLDLSEGMESLCVPATELTGDPSLKIRMIHLCVFPESKLETIEKAIAYAGFLGFTHVVLEFWGMLKYDISPSLSWDRAFTKEQIKPLVRLANGYGMEVIPMLNHLGHATQSRACMGRHTVLNQNPRLQMLFEPDGWTWCVTNPESRKLLSELRGELIDLCGKGGYFHLGCDEAYSFATCNECRKYQPHELLAEYLNGIQDDLAKSGRRAIIWHDQLLKRSDCDPDFKEPIVVCNPCGVPAGDTTPAVDLLDKRIVIADWQYDYSTDVNPSTPFFIKKGFDVLCCPWDSPKNVRGLCESARANGAMGVMLTTWHHLPGYIPELPRFSNFIWQTGNYKYAPRTEVAALLRKLGDFNTFETAGWNRTEVDD